MIEVPESRFKVEECSFRTIFNVLSGHRIYASRKAAEKIEIQIRHKSCAQALIYSI